MDQSPATLLETKPHDTKAGYRGQFWFSLVVLLTDSHQLLAGRLTVLLEHGVSAPPSAPYRLEKAQRQGQIASVRNT